MGPINVSTESVLNGFPHQTLSKITGVPDYQQLRAINDEMSGNAATVHSILGGGTLGHVSITLAPAIYETISNTPFVIPVSPGATPNFPPNATSIQIAQTTRQFDEASTRFATYYAVENALKKQLLAAVDPIYVQSLKTPYIGFGNVTVLVMLTHLYTAYADISPSDLRANSERMLTAYDPNLPFEHLVQQIQDGINYAAHGKAPFTPGQIVNTAYDLVFRTGMFGDDCKEWRKRANEFLDCDWAAFKLFFTKAHREWRESSLTSVGNMYPSANAAVANPPSTPSFAPTPANLVTETYDAIANLATATSADRATFANLTATVASLTADLRSTQEQLVKALLENTKLLQKSSNSRATYQRPQTSHPARNTPPARPAPAVALDETGRPVNRHYCWSHGYRSDHTSGRCPNRSAGHQAFAKRADTLGGSQANKPTE